jgi:predicted phage terminase large subunit-like protein
MGSIAFEQELQNNPIPEELRKFKREHLKYYSKQPEECVYTITVDPAIDTKDSADKTAIVVCGTDYDENIFVVEYINKHLLPSEIIEKLFQLYDKYKPRKIGIETVGYQKMLKLEFDKQRLIRRKYPVTVELKSGGRKKTLRIEALQPRFECGKIFIKRTMPELEQQLLRFPSPRVRDDIIDALAYQLYLIRPSEKPAETLDPDCFLAEIERRRGQIAGRKAWGNHKLMGF